MRARVVLALLTLAVSSPTIAAAGSRAGWHVGPLVALSGNVGHLRCANDGEDTAPLLAVDPRSPKRVIATYLTDNARAQVAARSNDGGRTWTRRLIDADTKCTGGAEAGLVDTALAVDSGGYAIGSVGWVNASPGPTDVNHDATRELTMTSPPRRSHFRHPVDVESQQPDQRGFITEFAGRLYLETQRFDSVGGTSVPGLGKIAVLTSANHGKSWRQTSGQPSTAPIGHQPVSGGIAGTGSHLVATWVDIALASAVGPLLSGDEPPGTIRAATSADGGRTWSSPVAIAAVTSTLPRTAVAPDGSVLVSWEDGAAGGRVHLARSVNFGATWKVTAVAPAGHVGHGITSVAANRAGRIAVLHQEAVRGGSGQRFRAVLSISSDHGVSWTGVPASPVMDLASYPMPGSAFDSVYGAEEQVVAVPGGFLCAFPVFKPVRLVDGHSDVAVVRVSRR